MIFFLFTGALDRSGVPFHVRLIDCVQGDRMSLQEDWSSQQESNLDSERVDDVHDASVHLDHDGLVHHIRTLPPSLRSIRACAYN